MRVRRADIANFGALRGVSFEFQPGVNVVLGANEAGKSTLFAALRHVLLTSSRLTKPQFARTMARYLPRPDGTVAEASLTIDADETLVLERRWGDDPRAVLTTADGVRITGSEVDERLRSVLPVRPGTYASIFLIDQAQLDATMDQLGDNTESRDEVAALLRRTREETGGVSVDAFRRAMFARLKQSFGRWDRERDRPEGGRGIERPWRNEVGEMLAAYYELETVRGEFAETQRVEQELQSATAELESRSEELRRVAEFVAAYREAFESLAKVESLDRAIESETRALT
ncbi:MAG TPA: AAA family ATPase, partial [Spirochaetia bacterium]|nr:AAA family ATPase [Spirochaetia bacterium]